MKRVQVEIDEDVWARIVYQAKEEDRTPAAIVRRELRRLYMGAMACIHPDILAVLDAKIAAKQISKANPSERALLTTRLRIEVYTRAAGNCEYCGRDLPKDDLWHVDHKHPLSRGGKTRLDNLALACARCNSQKGRMSWSDWTAQLAQRDATPDKEGCK